MVLFFGFFGVIIVLLVAAIVFLASGHRMEPEAKPPLYMLGETSHDLWPHIIPANHESIMAEIQPLLTEKGMRHVTFFTLAKRDVRQRVYVWSSWGGSTLTIQVSLIDLPLPQFAALRERVVASRGRVEVNQVGRAGGRDHTAGLSRLVNDHMSWLFPTHPDEVPGMILAALGVEECDKLGVWRAPSGVRY